MKHLCDEISKVLFFVAIEVLVVAVLLVVIGVAGGHGSGGGIGIGSKDAKRQLAVTSIPHQKKGQVA